MSRVKTLDCQPTVLSGSQVLAPVVMLALQAWAATTLSLHAAESEKELAGKVELTQMDVRLPHSFGIRYTGASAATRAQFPDGFPRSLGSGISLKKGRRHDEFELWVIGDRGPNGEGPEVNGRESKIFPEPGYNPAFGILRIKRTSSEVSTVIGLLRPDGQKMSGLPTPPLATERVEEIALDETMASLPADSYGIDPEAIAYDGTSVWVSDEYGPFLLRVDPATGRTLERWAPGQGLPTVFAKRRVNRGMECLTFDYSSRRLWGALQSVIDDGWVSRTDKAVRLRDAAGFIRWVQIDPATRAVRQFAYPIDGKDYKQGETGHAKLGDLAALGGGRFVVIEEGTGADGHYFNRLFLVVADSATDIQQWPDSDLERSSIAGRAVNGADWRSVVPLQKRLLLDLNRLGWDQTKAEGLALVDDRTLVVMNDSDFGVESVLLDQHGGKLQGPPEQCHASGHGPPLFGGNCPDGAVSVGVTRMPEKTQRQILWVIHFPNAIRNYWLPYQSMMGEVPLRGMR